MNWLREWLKRRKNRKIKRNYFNSPITKEFNKMFEGIEDWLKKELLSEFISSEKLEKTTKILKNMLVANGCGDIDISIFPECNNPHQVNVKIDLKYKNKDFDILIYIK